MKFVKKLFLVSSTVILSTVAMAQERIVSIGGDVTEIIYALNAEQHLVGRDSTSMIPQAVNALPDIGYMRQLNAEGILALKPTKVIATEVAQPSIVLEQLKSAGITVDTIPFKYSAENVVEKIKKVGESLGKQTQAVTLAENFANELKAIPNSPLDVRILFVLNRAGANQTVAGKDTVADEAIKLIGAKNAMGNNVRFVPISQEGVIAANPDLIVMTRLGIQSLGSTEKVWELPGIAHTNAGKNKQLVIVEDIAFMSFGLTTPKALLTLRQAAEQVKK
ncbi:hemin-binding periplasmic protein [Actinobacillus minor 202]|uniref:Hemin-binding periplasmic protein n=1 Tax=Actinobacillus minor 202 TaxID=591023 RepID=A0ABP2DNY5_9PAST|nr:ABC transporter substrate-binding protein [Actinobacillus minor]EEF16071.1 hemin-binding periplasmic protein [Actinobacillus minor 202]